MQQEILSTNSKLIINHKSFGFEIILENNKYFRFEQKTIKTATKFRKI